MFKPILNPNERPFTVLNGAGEKLAVVESMPKSTIKPLPVIILVHGFAYFKEEDGIFVDLAKYLSDIGYVVYRFDFSGCGESEGDYEKTTLTKLINDLGTVIDSISSYPYVDKNRLSFIGHSFGTNVIVASELLYAQKLVLSGSFYNPYEVLGKLFGKRFNPQGISTRKGSGERTTRIGLQFWSDLKKYDLAKSITRYSCPILFVHGSVDTIVPVENMYPLLKNAHNAGEPVILEGTGHDFDPHRELAYKKIVEFFAN